jgi:hypothetical protein
VRSKIRGLIALVTLAAAVPAGMAAASPPTCRGLPATLVGTSGNDLLVGTDGPDVIIAYGGADTIRAKGGDDVICAGPGNDLVNAGPGNDVVYGLGGNDEIWGKGGHDVLEGNGGQDELRGGNGPDKVLGGAGADELYGGKKDDRLKGGGGDDLIWGSGGNDRAVGHDGVDTCSAESEVGCEQDPHDFSVERLYLNQAVPAADTDDPAADRVATVIGRGGVIRAFVAANWTLSGASPDVVLHWRAGGNSGVIQMTGPSTVPTSPSEGSLNQTFNATFGNGFLRNGMEIYVEVDPDNSYREDSEANNRWPASGWFDVGATSVPRFDITFVPITLNGISSSFTMNDAEDVLEETLGVHPIAAYDIAIRNPHAFNGSSQQDWVNLLNELVNLRDNVDHSDRLYYGVLPNPISPGIGGIGYVGYPVSLGLEDEHIVAHELGHNLSLPHAPCGGPADADPNYPYGGGSIGSWGYDIATTSLKNPSSYTDLMSYCMPAWISDYNYANVLEFRTEAWGYGAAAQAIPEGQSTVSVIGSLRSAGGAAVSLSSVSQARRPARSGAGDYTLIGRDAAGRVLFRAPFEAYEYADGPEGDEKLFIVDALVDEEDVDRLAAIEVLHRGRLFGDHPVDRVQRPRR